MKEEEKRRQPRRFVDQKVESKQEPHETKDENESYICATCFGDEGEHTPKGIRQSQVFPLRVTRRANGS